MLMIDESIIRKDKHGFTTLGKERVGKILYDARQQHPQNDLRGFAEAVNAYWKDTVVNKDKINKAEGGKISPQLLHWLAPFCDHTEEQLLAIAREEPLPQSCPTPPLSLKLVKQQVFALSPACRALLLKELAADLYSQFASAINTQSTLGCRDMEIGVVGRILRQEIRRRTPDFEAGWQELLQEAFYHFDEEDLQILEDLVRGRRADCPEDLLGLVGEGLCEYAGTELYTFDFLKEMQLNPDRWMPNANNGTTNGVGGAY